LLVRFGLFEADLETGELRKQGMKIRLQDQPFEILAILLRSPGQIVTREELRQTLWGTDTFVDFDRSLNKAINRLREALEDSAENPRFIETIPKRGYRFIAPVEPTQAAAMSSAVTNNTNVVVEPQKKKLHASRREALAWGLALLFLSAAISVWLLHSSPTWEPISLLRTSLLPPPNTSFLPYGFAISPDGARLAFVAVDGEGKSALWIRGLSAGGAQRLDGTDGAMFPFWSQDNRHIGFFSDRKLKTIDLSGGNLRVLTDAPSGHGGTWNRDGSIVFAPSIAGPLYRIDSTGGVAEPITPTRSNVQSHCLPSFLPDGRHFVFYVFRGAEDDLIGNGIYLGTLASSTTTLLWQGISGNVIYSAGYLLYVRDRGLVAQPFDRDHLKVIGSPVSIVERELDSDRTDALAGFTASENGIVVFQSTADSPARLRRFDGSGREVGTFSDGAYRDPSFSPNGRYLAVSSDDAHNGKYSIRVFDLERGVSVRLSEPGNANRPVWSPDGKEIVFDSIQGNLSYLYRAPADASAPPQVLRKGPYISANHWSPDGRYILFVTVKDGLPVLELYLLADQSVVPFAPGAEAQFSPDGKWIAYVGQGGVAGGGGVMVQPFPGPGPHIQISGIGGAQPRWSRDGRNIFYVAPNRTLMSVAFDPKTGTAGQARVVFQTRIVGPNLISVQYDVAPDGRFLINSFPSGNSSPLTMITGWQHAK
jgi:eukaryotic-like serine/threonine-protein kinase